MRPHTCHSITKGRWHSLAAFLWIMLALIALAGCRGRPTPPAPTVTPVGPETSRPLGERESALLVEPATGGTVALRNGAEATLPPDALSAKAVVSLRVTEASAAAPIPRSVIGQTYDFSLEGGQLTGVALIKLPLPADVPVDQYNLAPYRWNGKTWERINGRAGDGVIQFGATQPGMYALLGQWNQADATLALIKPETPPGQLVIPMAVAGQYRYSTLPTLQDELVQAYLRLKQDTSGGAGRVSGDESLDKTIDEALLWFKPDPRQVEGIIEFSHVFDVQPGSLATAPGDTTRLYVSLTVNDSAAPTRRLSTGIEYAQMLPIQAIDREIVRPILATEGQHNLRWHVRLNGQTFRLEPAAAATLSLDAIMAQGGLGEYRFTLEAEKTGQWVPVSNDVTVLLTLPPTATPLAEPTRPIGTEFVASPIPGTPEVTPSAGPPETPTRRPTPDAGAPVTGASPTPSPTVGAGTVTPTPTRPRSARIFWADKTKLVTGECTNLRWEVENVISVLLNGGPVTGKETRPVCPTQTTTYVLRVTGSTSAQDHTVTITVVMGGEAAVEFSADSYQIVKGECTTLRWRASNVDKVFLNEVGVPGESTRKECPESNQDYELRVIGTSGAITSRRLTIVVVPPSAVRIRFWADQYTIRPTTCTMVYWNVQGVDKIYVTTDIGEEGVTGSGERRLCPPGRTTYTLRAVGMDGQTTLRAITLRAEEPTLNALEVIAQGDVTTIARVPDIDVSTSGDQAGYLVQIDAIYPLFAGTVGWAPGAITLGVPLAWTDPSTQAPVDWPLNSGQQVEFRAICNDSTCVLQTTPSAYLYLRSE